MFQLVEKISVLCSFLLLFILLYVMLLLNCKGRFFGGVYRCALLCVHSSFVIISGCFALIVLLLSHYCCVALPHNAMGLAAVCDCGISLSYSLPTFGETAQQTGNQYLIACRPMY